MVPRLSPRAERAPSCSPAPVLERLFAAGCARQRRGWASGWNRVLQQGPWAGSGGGVGVGPERAPVLAGDPWGAEGVEALRKAGGQVRASGVQGTPPHAGAGALFPCSCRQLGGPGLCLPQEALSGCLIPLCLGVLRKGGLDAADLRGAGGSLLWGFVPFTDPR